MPIWLRKFTFQQIYDAKNKEVEANKKAFQGKGTNIDLNSATKAKIPKEALRPKPTSPNYVMKASKK
jgi:hypothetical protein